MTANLLMESVLDIAIEQTIPEYQRLICELAHGAEASELMNAHNDLRAIIARLKARKRIAA